MMPSGLMGKRKIIKYGKEKNISLDAMALIYRAYYV